MDKEIKLNEEELRILEFWFLSCEDKSLEKGSEFCIVCPIKDKCKDLKIKLGIEDKW